jgi:hypothetical protein
MSDTRSDGKAVATAGITRRECLKTAAATGAVVLMPTIVPASVLGRGGAVAPSERIVLGGIGIGNRGEFVLNWMLPEKDVQFVAVCDVQKERREHVKKLADAKYGNHDCKMYADMSEFLATRNDVDAVLIAIGDRWHATAAITAMRAGKDVYCEKPSSMTLAEGRSVVQCSRRYGRIYQAGTQRLSEANFVAAIELARTGRLGKVHTVHAQIAPSDTAEMSHDWLPAEPEPSKVELDWDDWLGPSPWRPFNSTYLRGGWRGQYDFHTSCIGEWGAQTFALSQAGIDALHTSAIAYAYVKNETGDGMVTKFANGVQMILQREGWHGACGVKFDGTDGWVSIADGYSKPEVSSPSLLADADKLVADYSERTKCPMNHVRNFFDCVKSRRPAVANAEVMHRSMSTVHAANICMWLKRDMVYDPIKEEFLNDAEANRLRGRAQREPWII